LNFAAEDVSEALTDKALMLPCAYCRSGAASVWDQISKAISLNVLCSVNYYQELQN
jgi:hypothetical protein